ALKLPELEITPEAMLRDSTKFDIELTVKEQESDIMVEWTYSTALFHRHSIAQMANSFELMLAALVSKPEQALASVALLDNEQLDRQLQWGKQFAGTLPGDVTALQHSPSYPEGTCLFDIFERQARISPEAIALRVNGRTMTYRELDKRATHLAAHLQAQGCQPDSRIGLCLHRNEQLFVGVLGVLKAGAAYVPIDPSYPKERVEFMLSDADVKCVLTESSLVAELSLEAHHPICLDVWQGQPVSLQLNRAADANNLAYIIYTSGSTGKPKGVQIEHRNAVAMLDWTQQAFSESERLEVLCSTSISFDLFVFEIWSAWSCGGAVVAVDNILALTERDAPAVSLINTVPSAAAALIEQGYDFEGVQVVNLAGEPLKKQLVNQLFEANAGLQVNNLYGPSEDTTYSTHERYTQPLERAPSIGRAISNTWLYILDKQQQPVPPGVVGELYIGGSGVARGYLNRPELNEACFIENPYDGGVMYRTGDLVRWHVDKAGHLDRLGYQGRIDHQVKLRGFRIELGEIESRLLQQVQIKDVVVVIAGDQLVAYVVWQDTAQTDKIAQVKAALAEQVPDYMVPGFFVDMQSLPLTPNGKIDRKALPALNITANNIEAYTPPKTEDERVLSAIWQSILKVERVGRFDDFFALGGHSLLAVRVISQIRELLGVEVPLKVLFAHSTISALASQLARYGKSRQLPEIIARQEVHPPLSFAQQRLWFIDRLEGGSSQYNMVGSFMLSGHLDSEALASAFAAVVARHEVLRTQFDIEGDAVRLSVLPKGQPSFITSNLEAQPKARQEEALQALILAEHNYQFALTEESLCRVHVVK
ncbi:non-ribosomal peptide synthetase, partial [Pseudoalteromonas piscicida]